MSSLFRSVRVTVPHPVQAQPAAPRLRLYRSSVGKKAVMAVTGGILFLFLIAHMIGNIKVFLGHRAFNDYALWLRTIGEPAIPHRTLLTIIEVVLLVSVALHIWAAASLTRQAHQARPVRYAVAPKAQEGRYATHVMRWGGVVILLFVIWHLLDMTFGVVNPKNGSTDAYAKIVASFDPSRWYNTAFYVLAVILVGLHLKHGLWSAVQSLGWGRQDRYGGLHVLSDVVAVVLTIGFLSVPIMVTIGVVK